MEFDQHEKERLKKLGVNTFYLFGSRAQGIGSEKSDYDVAVLFFDTAELKTNKEQAYQELYELLADKFQTKKNIDIVFLHNASGQLRYHVVNEGVVLYDANPEIRGQFEERVIMEHADFEKFRTLFEKSIMERVA